MRTEPLAIVSADCHIGPRLVDDLRPYCPSSLLDQFDAYVSAGGRSHGRYVEQDAVDGAAAPALRNRMTAGHYDAAARRRDLDFEGVAAEVIFHGSQNDQPIPFQKSMLEGPDDPQLAAAGIRIYNRWLADFCAGAPDRHVGLAHIPLWDVDACVDEIRWARGAGLHAVNFPAPRSWARPYGDRAWEPFWAAAAELCMPLTTHSGAGDPSAYSGPEAVAVFSLESGGWLSRRAAHLLIFAGVFERHPALKLVLTEQPGDWWPALCSDLDSIYVATTRGGGPLREQVPRRPTEYLSTNVFIGGSFLSRSEAARAVAEGYSDRIMWGSDYPHMEGTFQYPGTDDFTDATPYGKLSLRFTFAGLPEREVRAMAGETAAVVYGLDLDALTKVARSIGAPTFDAVSEPLVEIPAGASPFAFRTIGAWA